MYEGRITGFRPPTVPVEELGLLMAGATDSSAEAPAFPAEAPPAFPAEAPPAFPAEAPPAGRPPETPPAAEQAGAEQ
jgi:hypothetical protein